MSGRFIVLDGIDGCGKSTQLDHLLQWLPGSGLMPDGAALVSTREPGGTPLGRSVRELLLHSREEQAPAPTAELLLYAADRAQHVERLIRPALAAADLGIAIGTGTQIAQDTAGMVLMGDRLDNLPEALTLARRTLAKVRQNLFWAFGYNLIVLPLAAGALLPNQGVLLSPPLAALLMAISSITVVLNALLLRVA